MRRADLSDMLNDANWVPVPDYINDRMGFRPNRMWHNNAARQAAVVIIQSKNGYDYALNDAAAQYLLEAQRKESIGTGYVVLRDREGKFVGCDTIGNVIRALGSQEPSTNGPFGPYYWIDKTFQP